MHHSYLIRSSLVVLMLVPVFLYTHWYIVEPASSNTAGAETTATSTEDGILPSVQKVREVFDTRTQLLAEQAETTLGVLEQRKTSVLKALLQVSTTTLASSSTLEDVLTARRNELQDTYTLRINHITQELTVQKQKVDSRIQNVRAQAVYSFVNITGARMFAALTRFELLLLRMESRLKKLNAERSVPPHVETSMIRAHNKFEEARNALTQFLNVKTGDNREAITQLLAPLLEKTQQTEEAIDVVLALLKRSAE